jgi:hypothetical protein
MPPVPPAVVGVGSDGAKESPLQATIKVVERAKPRRKRIDPR